ncbi:hypothetical protein [Saccharothrix xinjiangensis]|uniref:FXSXX-COOH protein n=1 Tax=Saccharothrix xinjiangensis TaxID=204798 RepID=A0ABV9Y0J5_9PSEU
MPAGLLGKGKPTAPSQGSQATAKQWSPTEAIRPEDVHSIIATTFEDPGTAEEIERLLSGPADGAQGGAEPGRADRR